MRQAGHLNATVGLKSIKLVMVLLLIQQIKCTRGKYHMLNMKYYFKARGYFLKNYIQSRRAIKFGNDPADDLYMYQTFSRA